MIVRYFKFLPHFLYGRIPCEYFALDSQSVLFATFTIFSLNFYCKNLFSRNFNINL